MTFVISPRNLETAASVSYQDQASVHDFCLSGNAAPVSYQDQASVHDFSYL